MTDMNAPGKNWRVILTLVVSIFGALFFVVQALSLGVLWLISLLDPMRNASETMSIGLLFWT